MEEGSTGEGDGAAAAEAAAAAAAAEATTAGGGRGGTFDIVLANPPFVPTPPAVVAAEPWRYRGFSVGGGRGDAVLARLVAGAPRQLRPGGHFLCVTEIANAPCGAAAAVAAWLSGGGGGGGGGCTAALLCDSPPQSSAEYAARRGGAAAELWRAHLQAEEIENMARALLFVRRSGDDFDDGGNGGSGGLSTARPVDVRMVKRLWAPANSTEADEAAACALGYIAV